MPFTSERNSMKIMANKLDDKLEKMGIECVRIGRNVLFDLDGQHVEAKVKEIISACKQHPKGAVVAVAGEYVYMFDPAGARVK